MARILLLALILLVPAGPLFADTEAERPEECPRESYWGPMPERADSTSRVFAAPETPLWARAANAPYDVLQLPVHLMNEGAKRAVIFADERDLWSRAVEPVIFPSVGPLRGRVGVSYDETSGPGGGLTVVHPSFFGRGALKVGLRATFQGSNKATAGVRFGRRGSDVLEIGGGWRKHPAAEFYGLGPASRDSDESEYTREIAWGGASLTRPILFGIEVEGSAFYSSVGSRGPGGEDEIEEEEDTPLALRFAGRLPAGYGRRSEGITGGIALVHDDTEESARPVRGGVRRASAAYFRSVDGRDADHWTWRFEVQQFLPLWYTKRALALRGVLSGIESAGDEPVPFDRLLVNDGPDLLRGFEEGRWRDEGLLLLSAEYRFPVWSHRRVDGPGLDGYLLADLGQVFGRVSEIDDDVMRGSFGGGLRVIGGYGFIGRVEVSRSEGETVFRLSGLQTFQFAGGGFYNGKKPVPFR